MNAKDQLATDFEGIEQVVLDPLRFKAQLKIGENAYASLRTVNKTRELWDVLSGSFAGAALAKSGLVASTFFAPSGLLGALGIGTAVTPIGWIAFAALASGGAVYGVYRLLEQTKGSRVIEIPKFLNTPLDMLGMALFDLIAPISLRLAHLDGHINQAEKDLVSQHFIQDWGLDPAYVKRGMDLVAQSSQSADIDALARELSAFIHSNPDCNPRAIAADLVKFFQDIAEVDPHFSEDKNAALARVKELLSAPQDSLVAKAWLALREQAQGLQSKLPTSVVDSAERTKGSLPKAERSIEARGQVAAAYSKASDSLAKAAAAVRGSTADRTKVKTALTDLGKRTAQVGSKARATILNPFRRKA